MRYWSKILVGSDHEMWCVEIYGIVTDCMKECVRIIGIHYLQDQRPNMEEVYLRIGEWFDHDTNEIVG